MLEKQQRVLFSGDDPFGVVVGVQVEREDGADRGGDGEAAAGSGDGTEIASTVAEPATAEGAVEAADLRDWREVVLAW